MIPWLTNYYQSFESFMDNSIVYHKRMCAIGKAVGTRMRDFIQLPFTTHRDSEAPWLDVRLEANVQISIKITRYLLTGNDLIPRLFILGGGSLVGS